MLNRRIDRVIFGENVRIPGTGELTASVGGHRHSEIGFELTTYGVELSFGGEVSMVPWGDVRQVFYARAEAK